MLMIENTLYSNRWIFPEFPSEFPSEFTSEFTSECTSEFTRGFASEITSKFTCKIINPLRAGPSGLVCYLVSYL